MKTTKLKHDKIKEVGTVEFQMIKTIEQTKPEQEFVLVPSNWDVLQVPYLGTVLRKMQFKDSNDSDDIPF